MLFRSKPKRGARYVAHPSERFASKKQPLSIRPLTSICFSGVLCGLLVWALAPLTSDANYKSNSPSSTNLNTPLSSADSIMPEKSQDFSVIAATKDTGQSNVLRNQTIQTSPDTIAKNQIESDRIANTKLAMAASTSVPHAELLTLTNPNKNKDDFEIKPKLGNALDKQAVLRTQKSKSNHATKSSSNSITLEELARTQNGALQATASGFMQSFIIKQGDTLSSLFDRASIPVKHAFSLDRSKAARKIRSLQPGKEIKFFFDHNRQWKALEYSFDQLKTLVVAHTDKGFDVDTQKKEIKFQQATVSGVVRTSLSEAATEAGLPHSVLLKLIDIYKWEIDFAKDVQPGDSFHIVYEKGFVDGKFVESGSILAAQFTNKGETIQAVRYQTKDKQMAYFKPDGQSLKSGFLRTPIRWARVTSGFSKRRLHPIKKVWKAHKGVDYGAKTGTPILATGDATVSFVGRKGGYGKTIILRHGSKYTTLYAHMSKFAKGMRVGKRVEQGQTIGYVGRTGWATGPHLHYEFRIHGQHKNPLKIKFLRADPIAKSEMGRFKAATAPKLAKLNKLDTLLTAQR